MLKRVGGASEDSYQKRTTKSALSKGSVFEMTMWWIAKLPLEVFDFDNWCVITQVF